MFLLAVGEEAGWTDYLLDPLQARFGAIGAIQISALQWWAAQLTSIFQVGGSLGDSPGGFPGL